MFELQSPNLPSMIESLPDFVASLLGFIKLESSTRAIVELEEHGQVLKSRLYPGALVCLLMKKNGTGLQQAHFRSTMMIAFISLFHSGGARYV